MSKAYRFVSEVAGGRDGDKRTDFKGIIVAAGKPCSWTPIWMHVSPAYTIWLQKHIFRCVVKNTLLCKWMVFTLCKWSWRKSGCACWVARCQLTFSEPGPWSVWAPQMTTLLRGPPLLLFPLQLPQSFSPAFIWLVWRALKKLSATRRKWWSQFSHKPRIMQPELLLPSQSYFANAIKCWSEGIAFLTGWEIISLSLLNQSNLKPQIMRNVI